MQIHFILVEPAVPQNVGASARAMNTMGFEFMRLVNPCDHLGKKARMLAHGSNHILESARLYSSLAAATEGLDLLIGTTANTSRTGKQDYYSSTELAQILRAKGSSLQQVGLVFGREESGLTNEELQLCDIASSIPLAVSYPSINLGQAVMLYAYSLSSLLLSPSPGAAQEITPEASYGALKEKVTLLLQHTGLDKNPTKANRMLERLALAGPTDIRLLHTFCAALLEKLEKPQR